MVMMNDIIFTFGTVCFLTAMIPAIRKVFIIKYSDAQSLVHNEITMIGHIMMLLLAIMLLAPLSIIVNIISMVLRILLIYLIRKKRRHKLKYKSDIVYYLVKIYKKRFKQF